jgi:tetratricopeptide (TPR) repeat protein
MNKHQKKKPAPNKAEARETAIHLYNEGVEFLGQGDTTRAESAFRRALARNPDFAEAHNNLGNVLRGRKKWKAAEKAYRKALALAPDHPAILANLGHVLAQQDLLQDAITMLSRSLQRDPRNAAAHVHLGDTYLQDGRLEDAADHFQQALDLQPGIPDIQNRLGSTLHQLGRSDEATSLLHAAVKTDPRFLDAYLNLAEAAYTIGAIDDAVAVLRTAITLAPDDPSIHSRLGEILRNKTDYLEAHAAIKRAIQLDPQAAKDYYSLGMVLYHMNRFHEAGQMVTQALHLQPDTAKYYNLLGLTLWKQHKKQDALDALNTATLLQPDNIYAHVNRVHITGKETSDQEIAAMEALLTGELDTQKAIALHFALGRLFDLRGKYDRAFQYYSTGNQLRKKARPYPYDAARQTAEHTSMTQIFSATFVQHHRNTGSQHPAPIFITGMPRSGKTTIEKVLAQYPEVSAGGELSDFTRTVEQLLPKPEDATLPERIKTAPVHLFTAIGNSYMERLQQRTGTGEYITNTYPGNVELTGLIQLCLPNAKVILCTRNGKDLCTDIHKKNLPMGCFYSCDSNDLASSYKAHTQLIAHWQRTLPDFVHVVAFEELVTNPAQTLEEIATFCGLDPSAIQFDLASIPAPADVMDTWQHYAPYLKPLYDQLDIPEHKR